MVWIRWSRNVSPTTSIIYFSSSFFLFFFFPCFRLRFGSNRTRRAREGESEVKHYTFRARSTIRDPQPSCREGGNEENEELLAIVEGAKIGHRFNFSAERSLALPASWYIIYSREPTHKRDRGREGEGESEKKSG